MFKTITILGFFVFSILAVVGIQVIELPNLFFLIAIFLIGHIALAIWWNLDIYEQEQLGNAKRIEKWKFYARNYPFLGFFIRYLIDRKSFSKITEQSKDPIL